MPSISKIRFTHVLYEGGNKRYNDETFLFDGHNGAIVLENGGGKTVFIQTALQAMLPHTELAGRKLKDTLLLDNGPAHVAIEWILNDKPRRRYGVTCVSLFLSASGIDSYRYAYEYGEHDAHGLDHIPFVKEHMGKTRPVDRGEIQEYYSTMAQRFPLTARTFATIKEYKSYLEENFHIIASEWEAVVKINSTEGGIENFFDECKTTSQLFDRLLIPTVEEAMEGFEQDSFVDMFQSHREGFKRYKELKEQIEENKLILQELGQYVRLFEGLNQAAERYDEIRAEAKAYQRLVAQQYEDQTVEQARLGERLQLWEKQNEDLEMQLKSLELAEAEQEQVQLANRLSELQEQMDTLRQRLKQAERAFNSLKYAEHRVNKEAAEARLVQIEQQIARLEQNEDEQRLQKRWERTGGQLRSAFARDELELTKQRDGYSSEWNSLEQRRSETKDVIEQLKSETRTWELKLHEKQVQLDEKKEQQQKIASAILANPTLDKVEEHMPIWAAQQQSLDDKQIEHNRQIKQMTEEQGTIRARQREVEEKLRETGREQVKLEQKQEQLLEEHGALIRELALLRPNWERLTSVYDKETSISEQLLEGILKRQEQKKGALQKERIAYRYVDDYDKQDLFFADPVIERLIKTWSRQLSLLQTGIEYIGSLDLGSVVVDRVDDLLWSVTLVTTDGDKEQLMQKVAAVEGEFIYPIRVLGTTEAAAMIQGNEDQETKEQWIVPTHWRKNADETAFREWKTGLSEQAELTRQERESKEEELGRWEKVEDQFRNFLHKYSLAYSQELDHQLRSNRDLMIGYTQEQQQCEHRFKQLEELISKYRSELSDMRDQMHQLDIWLKDGQRYLTLGAERDKLEKELAPIKEQLSSLHRQLRMKEFSLTRIEEEQAAVKQSDDDLKTQLHLLLHDDLYDKVQSFAYVDSNRTLLELKEEYRDLEYERAGIMKERNVLETELDYERGKKSTAAKGMEELLLEHPDLDTQMALPLDLEARKQATWQQVSQYRHELTDVEEQLEAQREQLQKQEGRIETLRNQFQASFSEKQPVQFTDDLLTVNMHLQEEAKRLQLEKKDLKQQSATTERQLREIGDVRQLWDKYALVHRLDDERTIPTHLEERHMMDFTYARMEMSERSISALQTQQQKVEKEQAIVRKGRDSFKNYCVARVKDVKLRQMAMQGIELKESYGEIIEFKQTMETRIQKAIHIMEETIQTYDRDLQEFIHRIHTHLKHIVQELRDLPKKTRIKTVDGWREIYSFSIPEWEDQDGKDRIRSHIEWILSQLEQVQHLDEENKTQQSDIRKSLEKWLDSKQLLQIVMKGEVMKVSCRKVMNDHQVTKASYSWEQSNRWSGGEKWSKNMTLFLGLLNYVAERRQYIKANMKLHRTVILDNPFGKASSDHVLSPVFFIAEQLGFQIIALTALAEGKFLQDYFPIVYSCRLRNTTDSSKQIIESTKRVQYAYFRDHAPDTLERIDSRVDQMQLF